MWKDPTALYISSPMTAFRNVGTSDPVDTHTRFALASDTKQFTGILLAMLADDGRIRWDSPPINCLPTLRFYGTAHVRMDSDHLVLELAPKLVGDLEHWNYDTFKVVWRDHRDGTNLVTFALDAEGQVDAMKADVGGQPEEMPQMKRVPDARARTSSNLK